MTTETKARRPVIGSRGSRLALWQAEHVAALIPGGAETRVCKTSGDRLLDQPLQGQLEKGFFTKEIEELLLAGAVDLAVHSLKDLPTELPDGLVLAAVGARAAASDLLLVRPEAVDESRPFPVRPGARVGATSLRRQALLRRAAADVEAAVLRGNVPTRVKKLRRGEYEAIILARAGVERLRLDLHHLAAYELNAELWLPAPGQGTLGVETRKGDDAIRALLAAFHDEPSWRAAALERELMSRFEGGCHAAFGAWAVVGDGETRVLVGHEDAAGDWKAAEASGRDDLHVVEAAYTKLRAVLKGDEMDIPWSEALCRPWRPSS